MRKTSQDVKADALMTDANFATSEIKNIQFTANHFLNSQESQKEGVLKLVANSNDFHDIRGNKNNEVAQHAPKRVSSLRLQDSIDPRDSFNVRQTKINVTPQTNAMHRGNTLPNLAQSKFVRQQTKKAIIPQFSFWSVVQIRKMMENIKQKYAYANLNNLQYDLIGDKSVVKLKKESLREKYKEHSDSFEEKPPCFNRVTEFFKKLHCNPLKKRFHTMIQILNDSVPIFNPSSPQKLFWDFLISLSLLLFFFVAPLHVAVSLPMIQIIESSLLYISLALNVADIFVTLNTGYFSKGQIVNTRNSIFAYYIKSSFIGDMVAIIPFFFTIPQTVYAFFPSILTLFIFIKFRDFSKILKKIEEQFLLTPFTKNVVELLKLLFVVLFVAHLGATVWIFQGLQSTQQYKWYETDKLGDDWTPEWVDLYVKAYYFNTVTMVTVGYGDIYPVNNYERLLSIGTILVACCIFAYIVNSIGNIFQDFFRHSQEVKDKFYAINNYMEKKNISSKLRNNIKEYLSYYWDEERDNHTEKEQKVIHQLPDSLKKELKIEANKMVLKDNPIFHQNFSKFINDKICGIIQEQRCHPEQIITKEDEQDDCSIYFIQKGRVEVFIKQMNPEGVQTTKTIMILEKGQYFGTYGFFTGLTRKQSIRCMEFSQFLVIKRSDFIETLKQFSDDYEKFCMLRDQLMFNAKNSGIDQSCFSCNSKDHFFLNCPVIHYAPDQQKIIRKYNFTSTHHVRKKQKRNFYKYHTLKELEQTVKDGIKFLEKNESFLLEQDWLESFSDLSQSDFSDTDDSREALDKIDKGQLVNILNGIPSGANLHRQGTKSQHEIPRSSKIESMTELKNNQHNNEMDLIRNIDQIDEVSSQQYHGGDTSKTNNRDDFNLGDYKPSPIPKLDPKKPSSRSLAPQTQQLIQETQKIQLQPSKSLLIQEQTEQKETVERRHVKNKSSPEQTEFRFSQNRNFFDVSLGPKQMMGMDGNPNLEKKDQERLSRRQSYWNMKVSVPISIRDIQFTKSISQVVNQQDKEKELQRTPSLTHLKQTQSRTDQLMELLPPETVSQQGNFKTPQTINQFSSLNDTHNNSFELQAFTQSKAQTSDMNNNLSMSSSLPKIDFHLNDDEDEKKQMNLLCVFDIQRFDDVEGGIITEQSSPKFLSSVNRGQRQSQLTQFDDIMQNNGGETQRGLLDETQKSLSNSDSESQKKVGANKNNNNNNGRKRSSYSSHKQSQQQLKQYDQLKVENKMLQSAKNNTLSVKEQTSSISITEFSDNKVGQTNTIFPNESSSNNIIKGFDSKVSLRIPLEKLKPKTFEEEEKKIKSETENDEFRKSQQKLIITKAASYKRLPFSKGLNHQTSIELTQQKKLAKRNSVMAPGSNLMINSLSVLNSNNKFPNSIINSNNYFNFNADQQLTLQKQGKSQRSPMPPVGQLPYPKDKPSPMTAFTSEPVGHKALKREKFWKNLKKHGHDMGLNDHSPLVMRAKQKLVEINSEGNTGNHQLMKTHSKSNSNLPNMNNNNTPNIMEESSRSNYKLNNRNSKRDYSPNSSYISHNRNTEQQISHADSQQIEQLKQMMSHLLYKFDEVKANYTNNMMPRKSMVFDNRADYIEENRYGPYLSSPLPQSSGSPLYPQYLPTMQGAKMYSNSPDEYGSSNNQNDRNLVQELIFDTLKNFVKYFPEHNITFIQNELNKISQEKLKQMKKTKIKKAKANQMLYNSLDQLSREQQFKKRMLVAKQAKQSVFFNKQEQSGDDGDSPKSKSHSGSNSKRKSYFFGQDHQNFSSVMNQIYRQSSQSVSNQSVNVNQLAYLSQMTHNHNPSQKFSLFKN